MSRDKILKRKRNKDFKTIYLKILEDEPDITWKAKGLHTYLISRPDGWEFNYTDLIERSKEGRTAVKNAIDELKKAGYLRIEKVRDESTGKFKKVKWTVAEESSMLTEDSPNADYPNKDNPTEDKRTHSSSSSSSKKKESNNIDNFEQKDLREIFEHWVNQQSTVSHRKFKDAYKSAILARLKDGFTVDEIKQAITNYDKNNRAENTYWSYDAWSLKQFLSRDSGSHVETFLEKPKTYIEDGSNEFKFHSDEDSNYDEDWGFRPTGGNT